MHISPAMQAIVTNPVVFPLLGYEVGRKYPSPFRTQSSSSCFGVFKADNGAYLYKDFATVEKAGTAISMVSKLNSIADYDAVNRIETLLKTSSIEHIITTQPKRTHELSIEVIPFTRRGIKYWERYGLPVDFVMANGCYQIRSYTYGTKETIVEDCSFAYALPHGNQTYFKIMRPFAKPEFKWRTNAPKDVIEGIALLRGTSTIIITKAYKEDLFYKYHYGLDAVSVAESIKLSETLNIFKNKRVIVVLDNDRAGRAMSQLYSFEKYFCETHKNVTDLYESEKKLTLPFTL